MQLSIDFVTSKMTGHNTNSNSNSNTNSNSNSNSNSETETETETEEGLKDMLEFVYGCKNDGSGDFCPTDIEITQHKEQFKKEIISTPGDDISASFKENVIGVYKDENIMNGGKIDNDLNGWDMVYSNYGTI